MDLRNSTDSIVLHSIFRFSITQLSPEVVGEMGPELSDQFAA